MKRVFVWALLAMGALFTFALLTPNISRVGPKGIAAEAKQNMHAIQLALERYGSSDPNGGYPLDLNQLVVQSYMPVFPENPYSPLKGGTRRKMQPLTPPASSPGDFSYLPRVVTIERRPEVDGYLLVLYGEPGRGSEEPTSGAWGDYTGADKIRWEDVVLTLQSSIDPVAQH